MHEAARLDDLFVEWPGDVAGVELIATARGLALRDAEDVVAAVGHRLDECVAQPLLRSPAAEQHARHRRPQLACVLDRHRQLAQQHCALVLGPFRLEPIDEGRIEVADLGIADHLFVEPQDPRLGTILEQACQVIGLHPPLAAAGAMQVAAGALMHEDAAIHLHAGRTPVLRLSFQ